MPIPLTQQRPRVLSPGSRIGRYEILARLASGGMATVYAARAQGTGGFERLVAVKVLHENLAHEGHFISMFLDEARLAARIRHSNVVPTVDVSDVCGGRYFLVMEYIEGDHLGQLLRAARRFGQRLSVPVVLRIMTDVLSGLAAAHNLRDERGKWLGLVHRDVSPHNIMVGKDGVARLTDFGVAKADGRLTQTREGQVKGKLAYMAPEQASLGKADERSDLFSVGVLLWESLTGRRLFRAPNSAAMLNKILRDPIALPSRWDPQLLPLDPIVEQALFRDPAARFTSAEEFEATLERVADQVYGGVASRRTLGSTVARLAREKLEHDSRAISSALSGCWLDDGFQPLELTSASAAKTTPFEQIDHTLPGRLSARRRASPRPAQPLVPTVSETKPLAVAGQFPPAAPPFPMLPPVAAGVVSGLRGRPRLQERPSSAAPDEFSQLTPSLSSSISWTMAPRRRPWVRGSLLMSSLAAGMWLLWADMKTPDDFGTLPTEVAPITVEPSASAAGASQADTQAATGQAQALTPQRAVSGHSARVAESDELKRAPRSAPQWRRGPRPRAPEAAPAVDLTAAKESVPDNPYLP